MDGSDSGQPGRNDGLEKSGLWIQKKSPDEDEETSIGRGHPLGPPYRSRSSPGKGRRRSVP